MSHITVLTPTVEGLDSGDPNLSLPGTGLAIPWGIDAVFYYNGLTFNNRTTIDKIRITSIEGLDDPDVRDTREDNVAEDGETPYDAHHGGRTLVFNGKIEAFQRFKLRDLQEAIKSAFVDLTEHPLFFLTGNPTLDHYIDCRKSSKIQWTEEQKDAGTYYRDFQLTLRASNPRFLKYQAHSQGMDPDSTRSLPISNFGNYTSEPIIIISGGMTDIEFNLEYGYDTVRTFKFKDTTEILDGDFFKIDVAKKTIKDSFGVNKFGEVHEDADIFNIPPGASTLFLPVGKCVTTSANGFIQIVYRDSYF